MRPLLRCLLAASVLLSVTTVAAAQAGRYIPIPARPTRLPLWPPGGAPFLRPTPVISPGRSPVLPPDFSRSLVPGNPGTDGETNKDSAAPGGSRLPAGRGDDSGGDLVCLLLLEFVHLDCPADPDTQELTALITFRAASFYVDTRTGFIRRGSPAPTPFQEFWVFRRQGDTWYLAAIKPSRASNRLELQNHVEELTNEQRQHAEECIAL